MRRSLLPIAVLIAAAACGREKATADLPPNDSSLARDLTLAGTSDTAQPQLRDVPAQQVQTPAPSTPEPVKRVERRAASRPEPKVVRRTTPPPPVASTPMPMPQNVPTATAPAPAPIPAAPATGTISRGTTFDVTSDSRVCTTSARPGDKIVARLASAVTGTNGAVFPAGSQAVIEVADVAADGSGTPIAFRVKSVIVDGVTHTVAGDVVPTSAMERKRVEGGTSDKKKVIGGAIAGAILGQMIGKNTKGTVIGAAAGGAAGAVAAKAGEKYESCLPEGSTLRATLSESVEVAIK